MKKLPFYLLTLLFFASCAENEPENDANITSEEAIASMENASGQLTTDVLDLLDSDGMYSIMEASGYLEYFLEYSSQARSDKTKDQILGLYEFFVKHPMNRVRTDNPGEMPNGLFEWDFSSEEFINDPEYDGTGLVLLFPVGDSETNNGKFHLVELVESDSGLPESVELYVYIDNNLMVELDLDINWSFFEFPEDGEVYLFLRPFTLIAQYNLTDGLDTTVSVTLSKNDDQIVSVGLSANGDVFNEELPEISGHIEYRWMKLEGSIDLQGLEGAFDSGNDPNEHVDVDLMIEGEKVGEVVLILETNNDYTEYYPYVEFLDGELYSLEDYLEGILATIEEELDSHSL